MSSASPPHPEPGPAKQRVFPLAPGRRLLAAPENTSVKRVFVAATRQNDGKTTTCLGLFGALRKHFQAVGYIKPIGQRFIEIEGLMIDEDSFLFDSVYDIDIPVEAMSPVAIDATFTRRYLTKPDDSLKLIADKICRAFDRAAYQKVFCLIEGSGHAGVGSVFDMSNAHVARTLGSKAIIVAEGGIGKPVDEVALNLALFEKHGVEVIGAILNKVVPDKMELVREYATIGLERLGVPLLGVLPVQRELAWPNLHQIVEEVNGRWLNGRDRTSIARIQRVMIGAMTARSIIDHLQPGVLVIAPGDREDILLAAVATSSLSGGSGVAGIILTRNVLPHPKLMEMISRTSIPVVICDDESYTVASRITSMTVKTQPGDTDKIPLIQRLVEDHLDLEKLLRAV